MTAISTLSLLLVLTLALPAAARQPMALGISTPDGRNMQVLDDFTASIGGNQPALWSVWSQWGSQGGESSCVPGKGSCAFPRTALDGLADRGVMGVVWWEPIDPSKGFLKNQRWARHKKTYKLGRNDAYIKQWAQDAKQFGMDRNTKIILRLAHEANGTWFPWTVGVWDNTPTTFKKFWRYVWRIFRDEGALPYVDFLWSVAKKSCSGCNPYAKIFPGNKYVDYAGVTAFNWGAYKNKGWKSMAKVLKAPMKQLWAVTRKNVIVSETASHFRPTSKSKAAWIKNGYNKVYNRWGRIKAILYLNTDQPKKQWKHPDWRLTKPSDGSALAAYANIAAKPKFKGNLP